MLLVTCIEKFRNKQNQIIGYRVQDGTGATMDITSKQLKDALISGRAQVTNLTLTKDGKIIDKKLNKDEEKEAKQIQFKQAQLQNLLVEQLKLGNTIKEVSTACGGKIYIIKQASQQHLIIIPGDIVAIAGTNDLINGYTLKNNSTTNNFAEAISKLGGKVKVIGGGPNLKSIAQMFHITPSMKQKDIRVLDISELNTANVVDMSAMFRGVRIKKVIFSSKKELFNTTSVQTMKGMFRNAVISEITFKNFDTTQVKNFSEMFYGFRTDSDLDLTSFNTSNAYNMNSMFEDSDLETLNITSFNMSNIKQANYMLSGCQNKGIKFDKFDVDNIPNSKSILSKCRGTKSKTKNTNLIKHYICDKVIKRNNEIIGYICTDKLGNKETFKQSEITDRYIEITGIAEKENTTQSENYRRHNIISKLQTDQKINYYRNNLEQDSYMLMYEYTIDELDCVLEANWALEVSDYGSSGFDTAFSNNPNEFASLNILRTICEDRELLTPSQFNQYIIGHDDVGRRNCNRYTFAEWILKHKNKEAV